MTLKKPDLEIRSESSKQKNGNNIHKRPDISKNNKLAGNKQENVEFLSNNTIYYQGQNMKRNFALQMQKLKSSDKNKKDTSYQVIPGDHIANRYETIRSLGQGSFGNVVDCYDHKEHSRCAVKVVRRDIRFTNQAQEEVAILERLKNFNPEGNVLSDRYPIVFLLGHFMFREHMCLAFELLGCSLYDLIKEKKNQGIPRDRARRLMFSVLDGLSYVRKAGIIHCDLKPENVLLVSSSNLGPNDQPLDLVKIIDFGSSCLLKKQCYPYIQSRFYRAPEVILRVDYSQPIDMWSFGCLVFEMLRGNPLFPGEDEFDQMACMMEKLGMPPKQMLKPSRVYSRYFYDSDPNTKVYSANDKGPLLVVPRYCTFHVNVDKSMELRANFSKRGRRLRKAPGAVTLMQALTSTVSSSTGKYGEYTPSKTDEIDNAHVVKLMEACLEWQPDLRTNPDDARAFSWFSYLSSPTDSRTLIMLAEKPKKEIIKQPSPPRVAQPPPVPTKLTQIFKTNPVSNSSSIREKSMRDETLRENTKHGNMTRDDTAQKNLALIRLETAKSTGQRKQANKAGSSASISSGENKQEERIIYARSHKSPKPAVYDSEQRLAQKKLSSASDVSLHSNASSINDNKNKENDHYSRKFAPAAEKYNDTTTARKRNRSFVPKRHSHTISSDPLNMIGYHGTSNHQLTCKTATMDSPEQNLHMSGRDHPVNMAPTTVPDINYSRNRLRSSPERVNYSAHNSHSKRNFKTETLPLVHQSHRPVLSNVRSAFDFQQTTQKTITAKVLSSEDLNISSKRETSEPKKKFIREIVYQPEETIQTDNMLKSRISNQGNRIIAPQVHSDSRKRTIKPYNKSASTNNLTYDGSRLNNAMSFNDSPEIKNSINNNGRIQVMPIEKPVSDQFADDSSCSPYPQGTSRIMVKTVHRSVLN